VTPAEIRKVAWEVAVRDETAPILAAARSLGDLRGDQRPSVAIATQVLEDALVLERVYQSEVDDVLASAPPAHGAMRWRDSREEQAETASDSQGGGLTGRESSAGQLGVGCRVGSGREAGLGATTARSEGSGAAVDCDGATRRARREDRKP